MTEGSGGYEPGKLITTGSRGLSAPEVQHVLDRIDAMKFWQMPAVIDVVGLDGAQWILEGYSHGVYQVVDRWSPKDGPVRELGLYLVLTLSGLDVRAKAIC